MVFTSPVDIPSTETVQQCNYLCSLSAMSIGIHSIPQAGKKVLSHFKSIVTVCVIIIRRHITLQEQESHI